MFKELILVRACMEVYSNLYSARLRRITDACFARGLRKLTLIAESASGKLYEFPAVTKVDGLPPAPSFGTFCSVENLYLEI